MNFDVTPNTYENVLSNIGAQRDNIREINFRIENISLQEFSRLMTSLSFCEHLTRVKFLSISVVNQEGRILEDDELDVALVSFAATSSFRSAEAVLDFSEAGFYLAQHNLLTSIEGIRITGVDFSSYGSSAVYTEVAASHSVGASAHSSEVELELGRDASVTPASELSAEEGAGSPVFLPREEGAGSHALLSILRGATGNGDAEVPVSGDDGVTETES